MGQRELRRRCLIEDLAEFLSASACRPPRATHAALTRLSRSSSGSHAAGRPVAGRAVLPDRVRWCVARGGRGAARVAGHGSALPGLVLELHIPTAFPRTLRLADWVTLRTPAASEPAAPFGIRIRPGNVSVIAPLSPATPPPPIGFGFDFSPRTPTVLLGDPNASRLEFAGASSISPRASSTAVVGQRRRRSQGVQVRLRSRRGRRLPSLPDRRARRPRSDSARRCSGPERHPIRRQRVASTSWSIRTSRSDRRRSRRSTSGSAFRSAASRA